MEDPKKPGTEVALAPKVKLLQDVGSKLTELLQKNVEALPKGFNETRFLQNCILVLNDVKDIEKCTPISIVRTLSKGAFLGLDFFRRECYPIPYNNRDTNQLELTFQTDYRGEIKLAKKYSQTPIHSIFAKLVREGDKLEVRIEAGKQIVNFDPILFNDGKILGAIAVIFYKDESMLYDLMSIKEIEKTRQDYSKYPNSPAWVKSYGEQCKKTVLRRLCKMVDLDFDYAEQQQAYDEASDAEFKEDVNKKPDAPEVPDPFKGGGQANISEATIVPNAEEEAKKALRLKFPGEEEWQIEARYKEGQR